MMVGFDFFYNKCRKNKIKVLPLQHYDTEDK